MIRRHQEVKRIEVIYVSTLEANESFPTTMTLIMTIPTLHQLQRIYHKDKLVQAFWRANDWVLKTQFHLISVSHLERVALMSIVHVQKLGKVEQEDDGIIEYPLQALPFLPPAVHVLSHWINGRYCFLLHSFTFLHFSKCDSSKAFAVATYNSHRIEHSTLLSRSIKRTY